MYAHSTQTASVFFTPENGRHIDAADTYTDPGVRPRSTLLAALWDVRSNRTGELFSFVQSHLAAFAVGFSSAIRPAGRQICLRGVVVRPYNTKVIFFEKINFVYSTQQLMAVHWYIDSWIYTCSGYHKQCLLNRKWIISKG
jgi:hypothetical protein